MSCFVDAMDIATTSTVVPQPLPAPAGKQLGENGSPEYTADGVGDHLVALFFAIVRGMSCERLNEMLDSLLAANSHQQDAQTQAPQAQAQAHAEANVVADAMLLAFQTRNCRGGKGERDLFYWMIIYLYKLYPQTTTELLHLIPHYGSYKDWFRIVALTEQTDLKDAILTLAAQQLLKDQECLLPSSNGNGNGNGCSPSLLAKWAPREKGSVHAKQQASALAKKLYPTSTTANCQYRQLISSLNKALNTIEVKMCANKWSTIDFSAVPSVAMLKYRKAFLNESVRTVPTSAEEETGNRHPENEERIACRKRLRHTLLDDAVSKLNGKQLFPHEIVAKIRNSNISSLEADLMQQQWNAIRDDVKLALSTSTSTSTSPAATDGTSDSSGKKVDLGKLVAVGDVSGSMSGTPMEVSIALSILVSELSAPEFAGRFLTFSEDPSWFNFAPGMSLKDKVRAAARAPWGGSTNFEKCMDLILETAVAAKLAPSDIPDLIVFSDMQFNQAQYSSHAHSWETQHELLVRKYKVAGLKACGEPWKPPHIIFWNLRGNTTGFPATADTEGVTMLSGFSPSLLKLLLSGEDLEQGEEIIEEVINADGEVVLTKTKVSRRPIDVVRSALDDSQYDKVRAILGRSKEGLLAGYEFEPPSSDEAEGDWVM